MGTGCGVPPPTSTWKGGPGETPEEGTVTVPLVGRFGASPGGGGPGSHLGRLGFTRTDNRELRDDTPPGSEKRTGEQNSKGKI